MTNHTKMIRQKPTKIDAHLEYLCPNCQSVHWLSLKEAQTKGFRVVCSCDTVFMVKTIESIKIKHKKLIKKITPTETKTINDNLIDKCVKALEQYGFEKEEIKSVVEQTINDLKTTNIVEIIKSCLITIGVNNGECD